MTDDSDVQEFLGWARHRAVPLDSAADRDHWQDLEGIGDLVGNVRVVGLGESHHYVREFNRFRSRLFKYLVDRKGFRVFVLECGLVEARRAYDYVLGEDLSPDDVFIHINNNFGLLKEVQELLAWMRKTNRSRREGDKLLFYGMDGSEGWTRADSAIAAVCDYLDVVDPALAVKYRGTLLPLAARLTLYDLPSAPQASVDQMVCDLSSLVSRLRVEKLAYIARSSLDEFEWVEMSAHLARDIGLAIAEVKRSSDRWLLHWNNLRDFSMAQQLKWIYDREGRESGILIGAHNGHLQGSPNLETEVELGTFSQYLSTLIPKSELYLISGTNHFSLKPDDPARDDSNQALLDRLGSSSFFLDIRGAGENDAVARVLSRSRPDRSNIHYQPLALAQAWDAIYFVRRIELDEFVVPPSCRKPICQLGEEALAGLVGVYDFLGVFDFADVLVIELEDGKAFTEAPDSDGELFPVHRSELVAFSDREFGWCDWPMTLTIERGEDGVAMAASIHFPTMHWVFHGVRRGPTTVVQAANPLDAPAQAWT